MVLEVEEDGWGLCVGCLKVEHFVWAQGEGWSGERGADGEKAIEEKKPGAWLQGWRGEGE